MLLSCLFGEIRHGSGYFGSTPAGMPTAVLCRPAQPALTTRAPASSPSDITPAILSSCILCACRQRHCVVFLLICAIACFVVPSFRRVRIFRRQLFSCDEQTTLGLRDSGDCHAAFLTGRHAPTSAACCEVGCALAFSLFAMVIFLNIFWLPFCFRCIFIVYMGMVQNEQAGVAGERGVHARFLSSVHRIMAALHRRACCHAWHLAQHRRSIHASGSCLCKHVN